MFTSRRCKVPGGFKKKNTAKLQIMGNDRPKLLESDCLFKSIYIQVEVTVPTSDPLLIPPYNRRRYGCRFIDKVVSESSSTVMIHAQDCTAIEAVLEYKRIWNNEQQYDEYEAAEDAAYQ